MKTKIKKQNISQPNMFCFVKTEKKIKKTNLTTTNAILNGIISLKEKKTFLYIK